MEAQLAGKKTPFPERLLKNSKLFPKHQIKNMEQHPGHAALIVWHYKIHSINKGLKKSQNVSSPVVYELYNLEKDPMETKDIKGDETEIFNKMKSQLHDRQRLEIKSLNGKDYSKRQNL